MQNLRNIFYLGIKEIKSLWFDPVMVGLLIYAFTLAVIIPAKSGGLEVRNASIAIVDEDRSQISARLAQSLQKPYFKDPVYIAFSEIDALMDDGTYTFVMVVPSNFEGDLLAGENPTLQLNIDATAMSQAFIAAFYLERYVSNEIEDFLFQGSPPQRLPMESQIRVRFNPNVYAFWFIGVTQLISNLTLLALILPGAALLREREHATLDHLLVMPLSPLEIMLSKIWSNGLVIALGAGACIYIVVQGILDIPVSGSVGLFLLGVGAYLFAATSIGIFLATLSRTMPQFGLLCLIVLIPMIVLSGAVTPLDSMPGGLEGFMRLTPSPHFVELATSVIFRGAGMDVVWTSFTWILMIGVVFFLGALYRFRASLQ